MIMTFRVPTTRRELQLEIVLMIGVVHGLGAETPSQLMIFLLAANLGGIGKAFLTGHVYRGPTDHEYSDDGIGGGTFGFSSRLPRFQFVVTALTAIYSLAVGALFLLDRRIVAALG